MITTVVSVFLTQNCLFLHKFWAKGSLSKYVLVYISSNFLVK
jgi:hypothetical protein